MRYLWHVLRKALVGAIALAALIVAFGFYRSMQPPPDLWSASGAFPACPARPSCVSSAATDDVHKIAPLTYTGTMQAARDRLERVVRATPGATILTAAPEYLHVLFVTAGMRFRDDVELLVQPEGLIQVRSLSRLGYGDRGVNRARVEALRVAFSRAS